MQKQQVHAHCSETLRFGRVNATVIVAAVICGIVATLMAVVVGIAIALPAIQNARESARRTQTKSNLRQIALAMQNYQQVHNIASADNNKNDNKPIVESPENLE